MNKIRLLLITICISAFALTTYPQNVNFTVTITDSLTPISPYIYGSNQLLSGGENWTAMRQGGNRMTGYNWENNASNAGSDYMQSSDNYLTYLIGINNPDIANQPGIVTTHFQDQAISQKAFSLVTLQMAGYVARDKNGPVLVSEVAPSPRWVKVVDVKGSSFSLQPDTSDGFVYMDEYVNFLVNKYGEASTASGVKAYELDNEPALWPSTHPRIHPLQTTCQEIIQKSIALSKAVKSIDSTAEIFGPALYGFGAYTTFQGAPDWSSVSFRKNYSWFIDYYLDQFKRASDTAGTRLLDVLDLHWYPEAKGNIDSIRITDSKATTYNDRVARVQAPRTLWDKDYIENSWIGQTGQAHLPLIPKLEASINSFYPGTKLAFTEFTYGGENDISGGIAISDVLGIFAKYSVYFASFWQVQGPSSYVSAAYKIYRNYDGNNSTFGNLFVPSQSNDSVDCSIYSSIVKGDNKIHLIVINKNFTKSITGNFSINSPKQILSGEVWELDSTSSQIHLPVAVNNIINNPFSYTLPPASVCHFVLETSGVLSVKNSNDNLPEKYELAAYPNPFNPSCRIEYTIPDNSTSRIEIYSVEGVLIKTFGQLSHSGVATWFGTNNNNQKVASGVYYAILRSDAGILAQQKLLLLK